jgi:hypothetical protein
VRIKLDPIAPGAAILRNRHQRRARTPRTDQARSQVGSENARIAASVGLPSDATENTPAASVLPASFSAPFNAPVARRTLMESLMLDRYDCQRIARAESPSPSSTHS